MEALEMPDDFLPKTEAETILFVGQRLKQVGRLERKIDSLIEARDKEVRAINEWYARQIDAIRRSIEYWLQPVENVLRELNRRYPKKRSIKTPHGTAMLRRNPPRPLWTEPDKLVEELKAKGLSEFVRVKELPALTDLNKATEITAEGKLVVRKIETAGEKREVKYIEIESAKVKQGELKFHWRCEHVGEGDSEGGGSGDRASAGDDASSADAIQLDDVTPDFPAIGDELGEEPPDTGRGDSQ